MTVRRFVIGVEGLTDEADAEFRKYLATLGAPYWHWIANFWLMRTRNETVTAQEIARKLDELDATRNLVMEISEDKDWHGFGHKNSKGKNMFEWLKGTWTNPD
jgi:hypothetical protein